jgi:hypothetical protein
MFIVYVSLILFGQLLNYEAFIYNLQSSNDNLEALSNLERLMQVFDNDVIDDMAMRL